MRTEGCDPIGKGRLDRPPIIGDQHGGTVMGDQATKRAQIIEIRAARAFAAQADEAVPDLELKPFRGAEIPIQRHDDMAFVCKDGIRQIHGPPLRAADAEARKDVENG